MMCDMKENIGVFAKRIKSYDTNYIYMIFNIQIFYV